MKFVVTGGGGSLGGDIIDYLLEQGHDVTAIDIKWPLRKRESERCRYVMFDMTEKIGLHELLEGADGVCHAGAIPHASAIFVDEVYRNNTQSTFHLFEAACAVGVPRVVNVTSVQSCGLFGLTEKPLDPPALPIDETFDIPPRNCYGLAKRHSEHLADMVVDRFGDRISVISLRFPLIIRNTERWQHMLARSIERDEYGRADYFTMVAQRQAGEVCGRALTVEHKGHRVCFAHSVRPLSKLSWLELRQKHFPNVEWRGKTEDGMIVSHEALKQTLGFVPTLGWDDCFDPERYEKQGRY